MNADVFGSITIDIRFTCYASKDIQGQGTGRLADKPVAQARNCGTFGFYVVKLVLSFS